MSREQVQSILEQIRKLAPQERAALADEVDRVTWRDRVQALIARVGRRGEQAEPIVDEEIDRIADEVRSEKPLYERYWTRLRRQSTPPSSFKSCRSSPGARRRIERLEHRSTLP